MVFEYCSGHGAWADGSGWKGVYDILVKDGYKSASSKSRRRPLRMMWLPPNASLLNKMDRPFLSVIAMGERNYRNGHGSSVAGLVYIAAHMPDAGENEADDGKRFPSDLSKSGAIKKTATVSRTRPRAVS